MSLENLIQRLRSEKKICPQPKSWNKLYELLPNKKREGSGWKPSLPLILAAWYDTSDLEKWDRFISHIKYGLDYGLEDELLQFINSLKDEDWHFGDL